MIKYAVIFDRRRNVYDVFDYEFLPFEGAEPPKSLSFTEQQMSDLIESALYMKKSLKDV